MTRASSPRSEAPICGVERYAEFSDLILERTVALPRGDESRVDTLLDGAAGRAVDVLIDRETRARHGIFFSGHALGEKVAQYIYNEIEQGHAIYDPTCGAGDLLIRAAMLLPIEKSVHLTLMQWGARIFGTDLHQIFVETTKRRLTLLALHRHRSESPGTDLSIVLEDYFPGIRVGDFLTLEGKFPEACSLLMNPPFVAGVAPRWVTWSSGRIQMAGAFLERALNSTEAGNHIVAVLPDVLRSGTRYARWRDMVAQQGEIKAVESYGRFDSATDVDVFILHLVKRKAAKGRASSWPTSKPNVAGPWVPLSQLANVSVGAVVPHRHQNRGPWRCYLEVSNAPAFGETSVEMKRRFQGTVVLPPFVVIRRTSNPADKDRLITTVITGSAPVAVENHLIIVKPFDASLDDCRRIAAALREPDARAWLDGKIRCRHLPTALLKEMPIPPVKA